MPAVGTIRSQMDDSDWLFNCCCLNPFVVRTLVRKNYDIEVGRCDCFIDCIALKLIGRLGVLVPFDWLMPHFHE